LKDVKEDVSAKGPWWDARHDRANAKLFREKVKDAK